MHQRQDKSTSHDYDATHACIRQCASYFFKLANIYLRYIFLHHINSQLYFLMFHLFDCILTFADDIYANSVHYYRGTRTSNISDRWRDSLSFGSGSRVLVSTITQKWAYPERGTLHDTDVYLNINCIAKLHTCSCRK